jgi:diguanylate cyclase (GGDEF)-like protein/PAS domain S-box-containing protein
LTTVTLAGCALFSVPLILLRRRYLHASGMFLMLIMLGTTTFIATIGQGIRDLAVFGFLIVIIFAGLALKHTYFRLCVGLSLVAVCWLFFGESFGWFATTPFEGGVTNWFYLVGMTIIFLITALAVDLLTTNMRKSLELARQEIAQRKLAEESVRLGEVRYRQAITAAGAVPYYRDYQKETHAYTFMGEGILQLTGYSADEITPDIFDQQERECIMRGSLAHLTPDEAGQMSEAGKIQQWICDYSILTRDGQTRWVADSAIQIRDENNRRIGVIGILQDITERKRVEEALRESKELFSLFLRHSPVYTYIKTVTPTESRILQASDNFQEMIGIPSADMVGKTVEELFPAEFAAKITADDWAVASSGKVLKLDEDFNGRHYTTIKFPLAQGDKTLLAGYTIDITERKRMEKELLLSELDLKEAQSIAHIGSWKWDVNSGEVSWSDEMFRIFGIDKNSYTGRLGDAAQKAVHPDDLHIVLPANAANIANAPFEYRIILPDGSIRLIWAKTANTIFDQEGKPTFLFGVAQDITESRLTEEQLRYQSTHDTMTGIYNRAFFETEMARINLSREFPTSIIIADVDYLKAANDTLGHATGDELLRQTANVLRSVFREGEVVARIGGDEFAVLLPSTDSASAGKMLARVQERLAKHNAEHPDLPPVQLSLGTATAEKNNLTEAFTLADRRMYADKAERKAKAKTEVHDADTD